MGADKWRQLVGSIHDQNVEQTDEPDSFKHPSDWRPDEICQFCDRKYIPDLSEKLDDNGDRDDEDDDRTVSLEESPYCMALSNLLTPRTTDTSGLDCAGEPFADDEHQMEKHMQVSDRCAMK